MSAAAKWELVLIAKVLQSLANGETSFTQPLMEPLSAFLRTPNQKLMRTFCEELVVRLGIILVAALFHRSYTLLSQSAPKTGRPDPPRPSLGKEEKTKCLTLLLREIVRSEDKVLPALEQRASGSASAQVRKGVGSVRFSRPSLIAKCSDASCCFARHPP